MRLPGLVRRKGGRRGGRAGAVIFWSVFLLLLAYVVAVLAMYDFSPGLVYSSARLAAEALYIKWRGPYEYFAEQEKSRLDQFIWEKVDYKSPGVLRHDRDKSYDGLTFYTTHEAEALLIDSSGEVVHRWKKLFSEVWPRPEHVEIFNPNVFSFWHEAVLMPNGDVIAVYEGTKSVPYGAGLVKVDKDSNLVWKLGINAHHDLDLDDKGNIYVLMHDYIYSEELKLPVIRDGIAIVSPDGRLMKKVDLLEKFLRSKYRSSIDWGGPDPLHTNNVEILDREMAVHFPMFSEGDILISMCHPNAIAVLDGRSFEPKWAVFGMTRLQHDPDFLDNGHILVFDNQGNKDNPGGPSRLIELDPADNSIAWQYTGTDKDPFYSVNRGSQERLPNGNVLITESRHGRIFEITRDGEVVWDYIDPSLEGGYIATIGWAVRYDRKDLEFLH